MKVRVFSCHSSLLQRHFCQLTAFPGPTLRVVPGLSRYSPPGFSVDVIHGWGQQVDSSQIYFELLWMGWAWPGHAAVRSLTTSLPMMSPAAAGTQALLAGTRSPSSVLSGWRGTSGL